MTIVYEYEIPDEQLVVALCPWLYIRKVPHKILVTNRIPVIHLT